jgi:hypothetical protein
VLPSIAWQVLSWTFSMKNVWPSPLPWSMTPMGDFLE